MFPISDTKRLGGFPFINISLIVITCYVFFLQLSASDPEAFIYQYALIPSAISLANPSTWFPFLSSMFLHGGWLHILSNMWFLWVFGDNVESELGHIFYLLLYIGAGLIGGIAQYVLMPGSDIPMLGASGAVAGALGAYFTLFPNNRIKTLIPVFGFVTFTNISAKFMLGYWFVLQLISGAISLPGSGTEQGGVAFWAHIGGFLTGLVIGRVFAKTEKEVLEGEVL
jgi:membrane associated rhomboid family serine protease